MTRTHTILVAGALAAAMALPGPADADALNLTAAEKTRAKCDLTYKVGDLSPIA